MQPALLSFKIVERLIPKHDFDHFAMHFASLYINSLCGSSGVQSLYKITDVTQIQFVTTFVLHKALIESGSDQLKSANVHISSLSKSARAKTWTRSSLRGKIVKVGLITHRMVWST